MRRQEPFVPARGMCCQIYAAVGLAVALMAIVGVVVGAVLGTAKKDAPPALDAVGFKPEDWQNVLNLCGNRRATAACQWPRNTPELDRCATQRTQRAVCALRAREPHLHRDPATSA